jgi:hypothetical protein
MSNRLAGVSPLNYQGTQASNPPNITYHKRSPIPTDWQNFSIGDFWIYSATQQIWVLLSLANNVADWVELAVNISALETLTGNTGGPVSPFNNNINVVGDGTTVDIVGNPITNTLTVSAIGTGVVSSLTGNTGGPVFPFDNNTNVVGDGSTIEVTGNPGTNTLTITALGAGDSFVTNSGTATPSAGVLNVLGDGTTIETSGVSNTITIRAGGSTATSFITSPATGTAVPSAGELTFAGTGGTTVSASGSTVTINSSGSGGGAAIPFTPTVTYDAILTAPTYTTNYGYYIQYGALTYFCLAIIINTVGSATSGFGQVFVTGMPNSVTSGAPVQVVSCALYFLGSVPANPITAVTTRDPNIPANEAVTFSYPQSSTGTTSSLNISNLTTGTRIFVSGCYF